MGTFTNDGTVIPKAPNKDPDSIIDYGCDWGDWLATAETIITSVWILPTGLTSFSEAATTTTTAIYLSGGVVGTKYNLTNRITTTGSRTEDRSMLIFCFNK
jgi:hypothetical protein